MTNSPQRERKMIVQVSFSELTFHRRERECNFYQKFKKRNIIKKVCLVLYYRVWCHKVTERRNY